MAIDGYFLDAQIKEFKPVIVKGKLRKITDESEHSIGLEFFRFGKRVSLLFNTSPNNAHMRIIDELKGNSSSNFLDSLKKELSNATLINISQYKKDRIIFFEFSKSDPFLGPVKKMLVFEVMGRNSNLILLDENMIIIDAIKKIFNEDKRSVLPNIKYSPYPTHKKEFSFDKFKELASPDDLFQQYMGFSKEFAEYIYNNRLNPDKLEINPTIYVANKISFHAYNLHLEGKKETFKNTSSLLENYYKLTVQSDDFLIKLLLKQQKRIKTKLDNLTTELAKNEDYESYKNTADLIYSSSLNLNSYYNEFEGYELDSDLTLNENAQKLYNIYKKLKRSLDFLATEIKKTKEELEYYTDLITSYDNFDKDDLEDLKIELTELGLIKEKKQKRKARKKYLTYKLDEATCLVGKTAKQNEEILSKLARGEDYWFHVKDYPGAHVILKGDKSEENIQFAAKKALENSPLSKMEKGYVQYTKVKYVKKIKERIGFYVSYKNAKTIFVTL